MRTVVFPVPKEKIQEICEALMGDLKALSAEQKLTSTLLGMVREGCEHPGQKTGHNERDGSWANPCPICGDSR